MLFAIAGVLQAVVRRLTYIGIEKTGATRSGPIRASLPSWVVLGSKLFLNDVEKITPRIAVGALLFALGTIAICLAKV